MSDEQYQGIAIIGMSGRFPGAESVQQLWENLVAGRESISFFSDRELAEAGLNPDNLRKRGLYVPARGVLQNAECFDAAFFGVHPKEAEVMDPQHRVFLEACWTGLEHAGYPPNQIQSSVGVFAGATFNTYFLHALHGRQDLIEMAGADLIMLGNEKDYLSTRVAYKLDLKGPAVNVSTACSTSLVAVAQACQSLMTFQCDLAVAGGVSIRMPQQSGYYHDDGNIGSSDGHTRTFDARANGTAFSNGVGVVVLKRLEEALEDGDCIYAVIRGAAINNDGSQRVSFGAPGVEGQSAVVAMAHALAGVSPDSITYIEAHGTATPLGDPIEVAALTKAFRLGTEARQFCALGSVKSNLGHLDAAAGITGLIKTALALHHRVIPASLHFTEANPKLALESSPFYVNTALREWTPPPGVPRRAGVSAFGTGGTNAHVVLEEAPAQPPSSEPQQPWQLFPLSAKTPEALEQATANLAERLDTLGNCSTAELADAAYTLQVGRSEFSHRCVVVCREAADGAAALKSSDEKRVFSQRRKQGGSPVVFMFPGQGSQHPGMGASLYRSEPVFRRIVDECARLLEPILNIDLRSVMFAESGSEETAAQILRQTKFAQPALFVMEYALAKLWMSWGIRPAAMIGHSVGEYVAACLSGVFTLEDALTLVAKRGALVQAQPSGMMLSVRLAEAEVSPLLNSELSIAAINSPKLCVIAGPNEEVVEVEKKLTARGVLSRQLHTSHAFHSPMMEPVIGPFTEALKKLHLGQPEIPYVSNVTARWITPEQARSEKYWADHMRDTVRFADGVAELMKDPSNILLEVGPGQTLTTLARQHPSRSPEQMVIASLPLTGSEEPRGLLETAGRIWMNGADLDWQALHREAHRRRTMMPTYPFERKRFWPERPIVTTAALSEAQPAVAAPNMPLEIALAGPPQPIRGEVVSPPPRKERLLSATRCLLQDVSGYDLSAVDESTSLLELGLDSLLLTQVSQVFQRKFGVALTFRQLMEELSSIDAIASHLDNVLPPDALPVALAPAPSIAPPQLSQAASVTPGSLNVVLEQLLQQQQLLTNQVLQALGRQPAAATTLAVTPAPPVAPAAVRQPTSEMKSHGPFRPIQRATDLKLSAEQMAALERLIGRYTERTKGSKRMAAETRPYLADPRSVSGFKQLWKEMVYPIVTTRSDGSHVWDVDGNEYIDFVMGFGASLFGHRPPFVVQAVHEQLDNGFEIGPIQPLAGEVASLLREFTGMPRFAFTNTGSEAVLAATRMARTVSGRDKIAVFAGAYHGIFDEVLFRPLTVNGETRTAPIAPGVPQSALNEVIVLDYGNPESLDILSARASEIAAVLVEPVQSRRLDLQPAEFLRDLRRVTREIGVALVFDEVVTGFRVHPGGAQEYFGIRADLATYGKVIGGGLPIGVVAGDPKYLDSLDGGQWQFGDASFPEVGVTFFAGTFVRHPLALAAAKSVLLHLRQAGPTLQQKLAERTARLAEDLRAVVSEYGAPYHITQFSSLIQVGFPADQKLAGLLFYLLRANGIHIFENRAFVMTTAHTEDNLARLVAAVRRSLEEMRAAGFFSPAPGSSAVNSASAKPQPLSEAPATAAIARRSEPSTFPLTEAQQEIWLASQMGGDAALAYNESLKLTFRGAFDIPVFRSSVETITQRHPILLARIQAEGPVQQTGIHASIDIPLEDLSAEHQAQRRLEELVEQEISTPFNLETGPLLRVKIVRMADQDHIVLWTAHHIVCDGWSSGVLMGELAAIYSAKKQNLAPALPSPVQFRDYAERIRNDVAAAQDAVVYWQKQFVDIPQQLDLPTDRPRPAVRSAKASTVTMVLDERLHQALKRAASQQHTTLVVFLMAALKVLLFRLSGQSDLVTGLALSGQAVSGSGDLVGHCVSLLPIRAQLDETADFQKTLKSIKKAVLDAYDHSSATMGSILQHLKVSRSADRPPLVEIIFNVDRDLGKTEFPGCEFSFERNAKRALHYDFFFNFVEGARELRLECDYNCELFDESTIRRWFECYTTLLGAVANSATTSLTNLTLLPEAERRMLAIERNATEVAFPEARARTLKSLFAAQVELTPDAIAVNVAGEELTFAQLDRRTNQLARYLQELGVGPEVLVGVYLERSLDMIIGLLGIVKAGGAYVPLDPSFPQERLAYMLEDSGANVLLTHRNLTDQLPGTPSHVVRLDADAASIFARPDTPVDTPGMTPETLAYVLYTSGSTGKPKGVEIPHVALANFLLSMQREPGFRHDDVLLAVTTLSFDIAGLELYLPLISGGKVVIASREDSLDPMRLMSRMRESQCTVMQATPATWRALIHAGWTGDRRLKLLCGGEALPSDLAEQLLSRCAELWNLYGPTETTIWSTIQRVRSSQGPISIGKPIANTQVFILDRNRNLLPDRAIGELYIGGLGLARGYRRQEALTKERFVENPFEQGTRLYRTGDMARWLPDGTLDCLGRADNQVKIRGFRIELGDIEATLSRHPSVNQCVAIVREDEPGDRRLVAYIQRRPKAAELSAADLRAYLLSKLPEYMTPSIFAYVEEFPLTPNGKINRRAMPQPRQPSAQPQEDFLAPRDPLEQALAAIWAKVLRVPHVGRRDDFFELGGHSLAAVVLLAKVKELTGHNLPLATLFQASTVEALAALLRKDGWLPSWSSLVPIQLRGDKPPLFLVHGAEGNVLLYRQLTAYLGPDQPVYGLQSRGLNGEAPAETNIQEMAAHYLKELLMVQPEGPYFLGGYCMGGTIAFEMAQQLKAQGKAVENVLLLDTYNEAVVPHFAIRLCSPIHLLQNLWFHAANAFSIDKKDRTAFLKEKLATASTRLRLRAQAFFEQLRFGRTEGSTHLPHVRIKQINDQAAVRYAPANYDGRLTVIRSRSNFLGLTSSALGWDSVVGERIRIYELAAYPKGMLIEPFCKELGDVIRTALQPA